MTWDYAEASPVSESGGGWESGLKWVVAALEDTPARSDALVAQQDAVTASGAGTAIVCTDPPYYDNIGYADLSDFFYVWLRRSLREAYPELLATVLTPKSAELVATPYRFGGNKNKAEQHFEQGLIRTFSNLRIQQAKAVPLTFFYAFKQVENRGGEDAAPTSTGWETMLEGLLSAGLAITGTWPIRTELGNRILSSGTNALASSIVLVCRPRGETPNITDRQGFLRDLRARLPGAVRDLQQGSIAPVDLTQAAIGPGMAVFSHFHQVVEPSGERMRVHTALRLINQVLSDVLTEQEDEFEPDTRWAIRWFEQYGFDEGPYGTAEVLATATNTAIHALRRAGILEARAGKVWLLSRDEMPDDWDPTADPRIPVWEATQHLIKRLESGGEQAAADLLRRMGTLGDLARDLAYRLYSVCERKKWATEALAFNSLVISWPEVARLAGTEPVTNAPQQQVLA
jgi:putative DNA methylase